MLSAHPAVARRVAAVPYDVVDIEEAHALADGNPSSFLHVSRAEIDLPAGTDAHADIVYRTAAERYRALKREAPFVEEAEPTVYLYHLDADGHGQTGVAACYSLAEYDRDVIKKHERTRKDKEDDRTRHMVGLRAQTGPVFLAHRPNAQVDERRAGAFEDARRFTRSMACTMRYAGRDRSCRRSRGIQPWCPLHRRRASSRGERGASARGRPRFR